MHISILLEPKKLALNLKAVDAVDQRLLTALRRAVQDMRNGRFSFTNNLPGVAERSLNSADVTLTLEPEPSSEILEGPCSQTATEAGEGSATHSRAIAEDGHDESNG